MISKGDHVKFARFVLLAVSEEAKTRLKFFFVQCIIKQLLDSVFVISRIIKVEVRVISRSRRLRLITLTKTLIILDITKTSSNNCLKNNLPFSDQRLGKARNLFQILDSNFDKKPYPTGPENTAIPYFEINITKTPQQKLSKTAKPNVPSVRKKFFKEAKEIASWNMGTRK